MVLLVDLSQADNSPERSVSLFSGRCCAPDILQRQEHSSVSQRISAAAAGTTHGSLVGSLCIDNDDNLMAVHSKDN